MSTSPDSQIKINELFDDFLANESEDESLDEIIEALDEVVYKALLEKLGYANSSDEQKKLVYQKMKQYMLEMDFNTPSLAYAEDMLHSIGASDYKKAAKYLDKLYLFRSRTISQAQKLKAQQPRQNDPLTKLLARMIKVNPDISSAEAIAQLESDIHIDVITDFDDENICYKVTNEQEKCVAKVNIASRLSRLRNKK
jgi:hypothetical protein